MQFERTDYLIRGNELQSERMYARTELSDSRDLIGVRYFNKQLFHYDYFVVVIPPDDLDLIISLSSIIKVVDYVIGDFWGQSDGRPTQCLQ